MVRSLLFTFLSFVIGSLGDIVPTKPVCRSYTENFTTKATIIPYYQYQPSMAGQYRWVDLSGNPKTWSLLSSGGLKMNLLPPTHIVPKSGYNQYPGYGPTFNSTRLMHFGSVEFVIKASNIGGAVTAAITLSPYNSDEIDIEFVGNRLTTFQSNYFANGVVDYTNSQRHPVSSNVSTNYHTYRFDWQPKYVAWFVDGVLVRNLTLASTIQKYGSPRFPLDPSFIQIGFWDGSTSVGTAQWCGGPIHWENVPQPKPIAVIKRITITCDPTYNKVVT